MVFACMAFILGHARSIRSGNALGLFTCPPKTMNGLPSTRNVYLSPLLTNCGMGFPCARARETAPVRIKDRRMILCIIMNLHSFRK